MDNEKRNNRILTALWLVLFIVAGICFVIHFKLARNIDYMDFLFLRELEFAFLATSILGYAIYLQTKKPLVLKILMGVLLLSLICSHYLINGPRVALVGLLMAIALPFIGLFGSKELLDRKKASQAKAVIAIAVILNVGMLGYFGYYLIDDLNCNNGGATLTPVEVRNYNAGFTDYEGQSNVKGSNIQQLIRDVQTHNRDYEYDSTKWINVHVYDEGSEDPIKEAERYVKDYKRISVSENITVEDYNEMINLELGKVKKGRTYAVACGYDPVTDFVVDIEIVKND